MEPKISEKWVSHMIQIADLPYASDFLSWARPYVVQMVYPELEELRKISKRLLPGGMAFESKFDLQFNMIKVMQEKRPEFSAVPSLRENGFAAMFPMLGIDSRLKDENLDRFLNYAESKYDTVPLDILLREYELMDAERDQERSWFGDFAFGSFRDSVLTAFHMHMAKAAGCKVSVITEDRESISRYLEALMRDHQKPVSEYEEAAKNIRDEAMKKAKEAIDAGEDMENPPEEPVTSIPENPIKGYNALIAAANALDNEVRMRRDTKIIEKSIDPLVKCFKAPSPNFVAKISSVFEINGRRFRNVQLGVLDEHNLTELRPDFFDMFLNQNIQGIVNGSITDYLHTYANPKL